MAGGEGYDWYYADAAARQNQTRSAITDGAYGKPWVFRYKDLKSWWLNSHYDRPGGIEAGAPTAWVPQSKPFRFTEAGCPAIDKGANQPNVFLDAKSSESLRPYFSGGQRDDLIQNRYVAALGEYWSSRSAQAIPYPRSTAARWWTSRAFSGGPGMPGPFHTFRCAPTPGPMASIIPMAIG